MAVTEASETLPKQPATGVAGARVLLLGRSPEVLETILQELRDLGIDAQGTNDPAAALRRYDPRDFDLISLGGGLKNPEGDALKRRLRARHPQVRLLDTWAPIAAHQIATALNGIDPAGRVALDAYFERIGYRGARVANLDTLRTVQALHPAAVPFEAMDVLTGRGVDLAPAAVDAKLIVKRRGGYCFEHNGLLMRVLAALGFEVQGLLARVRWRAPAGAPSSAATHMTLRVSIDGEPWLVDVGFGSSAPTAPLRMNTVAPQLTAHDTYRIIPWGRGLLLQVLVEQRWMPLYEVLPEPAMAVDYETANWFTSTHPSSHFRQMLTAARSTPEARYALRDNRLTVRTPGGGVERSMLDADGIEQALGAVFGLPVDPAWRPAIEQAAARGAESQAAGEP